MNDQRTQFYRLFWQHEALRRIFLLSKEELLEHQEFGEAGLTKTVFFPQIILANHAKASEAKPTSGLVPMMESENQPAVPWQTVVNEWLDPRMKRAWQHLSSDLQDPTTSTALGMKAMEAFSEGRQHHFLLEILQQYGVVGPHITTIDDLWALLEKEGTKKLKQLLNEPNATRFYEGVHWIQKTYRSILENRLQHAHRFVVTDRVDTETFSDRIAWLSVLYEEGLLTGSGNETWFACPSCPPGTYEGMAKTQVSPQKLQGLTCLACGTPVHYLAPYTINRPIFEDMMAKDGLILPAILHLLQTKGWTATTNLVYAPDIEIDLLYERPGAVRTLVETKMYRVDNTPRKLVSKLVDALHRMARLQAQLTALRPVYAAREFMLVCNVFDAEVLNTAIQKFESSCPNTGIRLVSALHLEEALTSDK